MPNFNPFNQKDLPEMSDADWKRLEQERRRNWELDNKEFLRDFWKQREEEWGETMEQMRHQRFHQSPPARLAAIAQRIVARSTSLDGMTRQQAKRKINEVLGRHTKGFFRDEFWKPVDDIWKDFVKEGIDAYLINTEYYKNDAGTPSGKIWKFYVEFTNEKGRVVQLYGIMQASGAGTVKDPLSVYDLVAYVS